ncbi:MAG: sulfotransferase [Verrucomicrobia bacterium]|nr:sulfotransferase [Verrucomicrobiota bacterium]
MQDVLYILSPSYSGSTLLTFLLAAHPDIATVGELKATSMGDIESYPCSCGSLLVSCSFWRQVKEGMQRGNGSFNLEAFGTHFNEGPVIFRRLIRLGLRHPFLEVLSSLALAAVPGYKARHSRILDQNRRLIELVTNLQGARVFLDGSKDPERLHQFRKRLPWPLKVIHLVRDGRGVTNSYMKHYGTGMTEALREWLWTDRACKRALSGLDSSQGMTVRYEDLCRDPKDVLGAIFRFAGIAENPATLRSEASDFHILGNSMRLDRSKGIGLDEKWRSELSEENLGLFERLAGRCNQQYGYASFV